MVDCENSESLSAEIEACITRTGDINVHVDGYQQAEGCFTLMRVISRAVSYVSSNLLA
jgi:hypothetical protein